MFMLIFMVMGTAAAGLAGTAALAAVPTGLLLQKQKLERDQRLGISPEKVEDESYEVFKLESLPASLEAIEKQEWCLTPKETFELIAMTRSEMLLSGDGDYGAQTAALCEKHKISMLELQRYVYAAAQRPDFERLIRLSNNRLADKTIRARLGKS